MVLLDGQGLEHDWKIGDKGNWGKGVWMEFSEWLENEKIFMSHVNA